MSKQQDLKTLNLSEEQNRKIYIQYILSTTVYRYNQAVSYLQEALNYYHQNDIHKHCYSSMCMDAIEFNLCMITNLIGDSQDTSISYFKYRNICRKKNYPLSDITKEEEDSIKNFNRKRNFIMHCAESVLVTHLKQYTEKGFLNLDNPSFFTEIHVPNYEYIDSQYLYRILYGFSISLKEIEHIIKNCIYKEYFKLCGSFELKILSCPIMTADVDDAMKEAAYKIQKITTEVPESWIN